MSQTVPGRQVARYALRDGHTALFFIIRAGVSGARPVADVAAQQELLSTVFADVGW